MKLYDISIEISEETPIYPGDPQIQIEPVSSLESGDGCNLTRLSLATHTGTHLDAPRHFIGTGMTVEQLPLAVLIGKALVAEVKEQVITREVLTRLHLKGVERLLLKTGNSALWARQRFSSEYAHLSEDGARFLVERGVRLIGIDYLSIEKFNGSGSVHRTLLGNEVVILEGLDLGEVPAGEYELICLPLKISGGDGSPARAVLRSIGHGSQAADFDPHTSRWPLA